MTIVRAQSQIDMPSHAAVKAALDIPAISTLSQRTVDITTLGARSGRWRRIEIWFYNVDGRYYLTGRPPRRRGWYSNLQSNPRFMFHLKHSEQADLNATARPVTDPDEREHIFRRIVGSLNDPSNPAGFPDRPPVGDWIASSPLVEVIFDEFEAAQVGPRQE